MKVLGDIWLDKEVLKCLRQVLCGFNVVFELYGHIIPKEEW